MSEFRWVILALLGALFAAIVSVMTKKALDKTDFNVALTIQAITMLATLAILTTFLRRWEKVSDAPRWALGRIAASGVAAGVSWFFGYQALQLSKVAKSTPIDKLSMPIGVILAMVFLHERPSAMNWIGIGLMALGAFFVAYQSS